MDKASLHLRVGTLYSDGPLIYVSQYTQQNAWKGKGKGKGKGIFARQVSIRGEKAGWNVQKLGCREWREQKCGLWSRIVSKRARIADCPCCWGFESLSVCVLYRWKVRNLGFHSAAVWCFQWWLFYLLSYSRVSPLHGLRFVLLPKLLH